ncbi:hypothetical protein M422DRAFT_156184 [Sphaerobolus stellatus SS14]|nr:hypothetical protein M422DRAFT_156184 [Sphaerobolus stellatus SS14]
MAADSETPATPTVSRQFPMAPTVQSPLRAASPTPSNASASTLTGAMQSGSPRRPRTPNTPGTPPRRFSKARDLLRKHYGLSLGPPTPTGNAADPMDIDSPAFNAKTYYEQLITTSSLPVLLKRENDLLTEIRELDSERQSLVYNHHHELIAASDTISAVKIRAEALESDLDKLKDAFSEISRLCAQVTFESRVTTDNPSGSAEKPS